MHPLWHPCAATTIHESCAYLHVFSPLKDAIAIPHVYLGLFSDALVKKGLIYEMVI